MLADMKVSLFLQSIYGREILLKKFLLYSNKLSTALGMRAYTASMESRYINNVSNALQSRGRESFQPREYPVLRFRRVGKLGKNGYELILAKFKFGAVAICARVRVLRITSCAKFNLARI